MEPEALMHVKERYLLEAIVDEEKIDATEEEVEEDITKLSEMYNIEKDKLVEMIGGKDVIKYDVKMKKALEVLKNN